jgi:hypothetical protein
MSSGKDWVPRKEQNLLELCGTWDQHITDPQWTAGFGWDETEVGEVVAAIQMFMLARRNYLDDKTSFKRKDKDIAMKAAKAKMREFYESSIRFNKKIPLEKKRILGWRDPDTEPTPAGKPVKKIEFSLEPDGIRVIKVPFWVPDSDSKARPERSNGAVIKWRVGDKAFTSVKELTEDDLATHSPYVLEFNDEDRGKIVTVAMRWQGTTSGKGQWSDIKSTIIP